MTLHVDLCRIGASRVAFHAIPIVARVKQGAVYGEDLLRRLGVSDIECAKDIVSGLLSDKLGKVEIVWMDNTNL